MATVPSSPILIWTPGGGVSGGPISNPPVYSQAGITALIEGQAYIDVVFGSIQTMDDWVLATCEVENTTDFEPLNIWPGIITDRTTAGFRLQLNGMPDSGNYYLHWAVSGVNITPTPATSYLLTGPTSGGYGVASTFTVALPPSTILSAPVVVTPTDGSVIGTVGTFSPAFVTLTTGSPSVTFTYTPTTYSSRTISTTNSGPLTDPVGIMFSVFAATYTFTGPSSGATGVASTNFTVALPVGALVTGTVTVTPHDGGGGGTFTPTTVGLTTGAPSATFTYTPASSGAKTLSVTNDGGLTNPANITYTAAFSPIGISGLKLWLKADALALTDGDAVATWTDSSGNGNDFVMVTPGQRPLYKTNRLNGLPALKFDGIDDYMQRNMIGAVTTAASVFTVVRKNLNNSVFTFAALVDLSTQSPATNAFVLYTPFSDGNVYFDLGDTTVTGRVTAAWGGDFTHFFLGSFVAGGGNMAIYRNGTTVISTGGHTNTFNPAGLLLALCGKIGTVMDADVAEVLIYNVALNTTDRQAIESYLTAKYAL